MRKLKQLLSSYGLYLAWIVSLIGLLGSLYFSEIAGYAPCTLCWVQRIFMYPLALLLGIAQYLNDKSIIKYVMPLTVIGACIAGFHYMQQKVPAFAQMAPCTSGVPCSGQYINWIGFITIPFLSFMAFILITVILWVSRK